MKRKRMEKCIHRTQIFPLSVEVNRGITPEEKYG
jgi:hypothetical protein